MIWNGPTFKKLLNIMPGKPEQKGGGIGVYTLKSKLK